MNPKHFLLFFLIYCSTYLIDKGYVKIIRKHLVSIAAVLAIYATLIYKIKTFEHPELSYCFAYLVFTPSILIITIVTFFLSFHCGKLLDSYYFIIVMYSSISFLHVVFLTPVQDGYYLFIIPNIISGLGLLFLIIRNKSIKIPSL